MLRPELLRPVNTPLDRETVQALWETSSRRLHAWFVARTASAHDADDLVQETFTRALAKLSSVRSRERVGAWLAAVAANVLADHRRSRRPAPLADDDELAAALEDEDLSAAVAGWIEPFLVRLDAADAALLRAVDLEGRAQIDVARELGLSPSGARSRVQRARERLKQELESCCRFAFDARGNLTDTVRRPGSTCACDDEAP